MREKTLRRNQKAGNKNREKTRLSEKIREWTKKNNWYRVEAHTNQLKLEREFRAAIYKIAGQLDCYNRGKHRRQVFDCWDNLTAKCRQIDLICRAGCRSEEEMLELEFLRSKAVGAATELAEVLELLQADAGTIHSRETEKAGTEGKNKPSDCYITFAQAAELLAVGKGTVSKWAAAGRMADNGMKGQKRKLLKSSVLLVKQELEDEEIKKDAKELRKDAALLK